MIFKQTFHWVTTAVHFGQMRTIVECHRFLWNTFCSCSYYCQYYYCVATCAHLTEVPDPTTLLKKKKPYNNNNNRMLCIRASSTAGMKKNSYFRLFFSVSVFSFSLCLSFFIFFFTAVIYTPVLHLRL